MLCYAFGSEAVASSPIVDYGNAFIHIFYKLAVGQNINVLIEKLGGIICRDRTSCPDQLAKALMDYKERKAHPEEKPSR